MTTATLDKQLKQNLPTTVFVIDDDSVVLRRLTRESLRQTNLGVLTAEDLSTAATMLDKFPVGAILADLNFRADTQDAGRRLFNGLDFLAYARKRYPALPVYVMSMDADDRASRTQATEMGLSVGEWYDKLQPHTGQFSAWTRIERDLILRALRSEQGFRDKATEVGQNPADLLTDERVAEKVRTIFNYPRLTYLQYLHPSCGYRLKEPIEVHCWPEGNEFKARAARVPLIVDATGEDAVEALDNLAEMIVSEKHALESEDESRVTGYAKFIREQLSACIERSADR